jgi:hypothetical protein
MKNFFARIKRALGFCEHDWHEGLRASLERYYSKWPRQLMCKQCRKCGKVENT